MKGPTRLVQLQPIHVLTHELTLLLAAHGGKLSINQIVPEYKEMFDKLLVISEYGFSKLIRALEAMADTVTVSLDPFALCAVFMVGVNCYYSSQGKVLHVLLS